MGKEGGIYRFIAPLLLILFIAQANMFKIK